MKTLTISVTEEQATLLEEAVAEGKFASDSDLVRDALSLWQRREKARRDVTERLRREYRAGLDSGPPEDLEFDEVLAELHAEHTSRG